MNQTYQKILEFSFDEGMPDLPFAARLARENGWSRAYAARAIHEYRRFMTLMVIANHPVTPSEHVDQVWHLHLLYTRNYWDQFCGKLLGTPLHHDPTEGGLEEGAKFRNWYSNTLKSYETLFHEPAPKDIWPDVDSRFRQQRTFLQKLLRRAS